MQKSRSGREGGTYLGQLLVVLSGRLSGEDGEENASQGQSQSTRLRGAFFGAGNRFHRELGQVAAGLFQEAMTKGEVSKAFTGGLQFLQSKNSAATLGEAPWNWG